MVRFHLKLSAKEIFEERRSQRSYLHAPLFKNGIKVKGGEKRNLLKNVLHGMLAQRPYYDSNFWIFPMAMKILKNQANRKSDREAT